MYICICTRTHLHMNIYICVYIQFNNHCFVLFGNFLGENFETEKEESKEI